MERNSSGFTLIEVVISMLIISTLAVGALGTVFYARRSAGTAQQKMIAMHLLEKKLSDIKTSTAVPAVGTGTPEDVSSELNHGVLQIVVDNQVEDVPGSSPVVKDATLYHITVTVQWDNPWNRTERPNLTTPRDRRETLSTVLYKAST